MVTTAGRKSSAALAATPFRLPSERLKPPAELTGEARQAFLDIVTAARAQHFEPLDMPLLCAFARAVAMERAASAVIMSDMPTSAAMLEVYRTATRTMQMLSIRLRIGPQSRAGHTNARSRTRDDAPVSYYDRMRLERGNG
jgi:hypothetical protein